MNELEVFVLADQTLNRVVAQIRDNQWGMVMPADFPTSQPDQRLSLREVINYHAYEDAWVPDMLAGKTMDEAGRDKFDGDLLGEDPVGNFARIVTAACAAAQATPAEDLERPVHCSFGDFSAREYLWQINSFRGLRVHDLAKVLGLDPALPSELVQGLWDEISPHAQEWRTIGVFPAAIEVPEDAPLQDRLLGLTGRQPDHPQ